MGLVPEQQQLISWANRLKCFLGWCQVASPETVSHFSNNKHKHWRHQNTKWPDASCWTKTGSQM